MQQQQAKHTVSDNIFKIVFGNMPVGRLSVTYGERRDKASWVDSYKYPKGAEIGMSTAFRRATTEPTVSA